MNLDAERAGREPDALERLAALVDADMARVNQIILKQMQSPVALIPELAGHIIAAGGKRLRPILTLAAARMCGYRAEHQPRSRHAGHTPWNTRSWPRRANPVDRSTLGTASSTAHADTAATAPHSSQRTCS